MALRRLTMIVAVALLATSFLAPGVSAHHCDTKINVYGRLGSTPMTPPPYTSTTQGICLRLFNEGVVDDHSLPPNTEQIMVRVNGDFGPSITTLTVQLYGLGFENNLYTLHRTANQFGGFTYNLPEWVSLPNGPTTGELLVTVFYPTGAHSVRYHTTAVVPPALPPV